MENIRNKIKTIVETIERITPYMPPMLRGTNYLFLHEDILYMSTPSEPGVYQERLKIILKEECPFIEDVYFLDTGE
jgi:hypothetical protein